tara:strand:- start:280 stop:591 length:312 start_codon:yes stop_codon:yes gene_type:complete
MNIEKIYNEFLDSDEAVDAEVTSSGVMLSKEDCLTLMRMAVKSESISGVSERFSIGQMVEANGHEFKVVEDTGGNNVLISSNRSIKDKDYNDWWIPRENLNAI